MSFDPIPYDFSQGVLNWLITVAMATGVALFVGFAISLLTNGLRGPGVMWDVLCRSAVDLTHLSLRRIGAVSSLTFKESYRKKALAVLIVFIVIFLLAGFFLRPVGHETLADEMPAKPYVAFVLTTIRWLCLPVALLLACWGLPADIKDRSLHTVVTKPVRRSEVVIGRMLGYGLVVSVVLGAMALAGYEFIRRSVPEGAQDQLVSRVPIYGSLLFLDRTGNPSYDPKDPTRSAAYNVGDVFDFRSFIEGQTKSAAIWTFDHLDVAQLQQAGELRLENRFEAFRTYKGTIDEPVQYRLTLINKAKNLRVTNSDMVNGVAEFSQEMQSRPNQQTAEQSTSLKARPSAVMTIPRTISYIDLAGGGAGESKTADLFADILDGDKLTIEVTCIDAQQYLGAAPSDLFIRLPDRPFASTYFKSVLGMWLMLMLLCVLGTTASCFAKGPVATMLIFSMVLVGQVCLPFLDELLEQFSHRKEGVLGGGMLESVYRIVRQMNLSAELPDNPGMTQIHRIDNGIFHMLGAFRHVIPNFNYFDTSEYSANGFDVAWNTALAPSVVTALAYVLPCILLAYFSLQLRELESK